MHARCRTQKLSLCHPSSTRLRRARRRRRPQQRCCCRTRSGARRNLRLRLSTKSRPCKTRFSHTHTHTHTHKHIHPSIHPFIHPCAVCGNAGLTKPALRHHATPQALKMRSECLLQRFHPYLAPKSPSRPPEAQTVYLYVHM